ncbi:TonB-dependent receptor plug domain-containing protein [Sphingomonas quercus]|uniref:TonB-dependent receptor n=1 Tax=Sphingomonas quercus TaxID=2842451 RepID=A0ABS6BLY0_9SPHN|nr:TonB-dependent receptor [Sphingomonas quercus]MBU3079308.1 TonB-dependent receptor [Sphingomonas quercus]
MASSTILRAVLLVGTAGFAIGTANAQSVAIPAGQGPAVQSNPTAGAQPGDAAAPADSARVASASASSAQAGDDIVVTGSRIVANGYQAPTPVTVVSTTELLKQAPESLAAGLARLPQFVNTAGANVTSSQAGTPSAGNYLNLRRLGAIETLLLLDGQRLPPTSFDGTTDANIIPQALVQRVDVVTGGASAAYGSDAVAGVVNFVLDTKFDGVKVNGQTGVSSRGDNAQQKFAIAVGKSFLDDRLHLEASFDYFHQPGIVDNGQRPYGGNYDGGWVNVGKNPLRVDSNGKPCAAGVCPENAYTPVYNVRLANGTYGTLINFGRTAAQSELRSGQTPFSLAGYTFEPTLVGGPVSANGVHRADLGTPTGTPNFNVGGADTAVTFGTTLTSMVRTKQAFARADYDFGGGISGFLQGSYSDSDNSYVTVGAGTQFQSFQIFADNAFLPQYVRDQMAAQNVASFVASRVEADQEPKRVLTNNKAFTILGGFKGSLFDNFKWNVNFSHGESKLKTEHRGNFDQTKWFAALDAVDEGRFRTGTANGNIVCRMNLTNPGLLPGCLPWNPFGNGSPSQASYDYFQTSSRYSVTQKSNDIAASLTGSLFDLPAGPVSFAAGAEYRTQKLVQTSNANPSQPIPLYDPGVSESGKNDPTKLNGQADGLRTAAGVFNNLWNSTNVGASFGKQNIKEAYGELAVPILADVPFFHRLDLNGAARYVDYSVSGSIWAWKVGGSWSPIEELRFRGTLSRDIRAPTLYELFKGVSSQRGTFTDLHTGANTNLITLSTGNINLKPEKARTITLGGIWQPRWIPGFSVSLDYYNIRIKDQITTLSNNTINQLCEDSNGTSATCNFIIRPLPFENRTPDNFPLSISTTPFNQAYAIQKGLDYEVNYRLPVGNGELDLRFLGNHVFKYVQASDPNALYPNYLAGAAAGVPKDSITVSADYSIGRFNIGANVRYVGALYYTKQPNVFVDNNRISPVAYLNANISYDIVGGAKPITMYFNGSNLLDKFVFAPQNNAQPTEFYPSFQSQYDVVGRYFVVGVRARF